MAQKWLLPFRKGRKNYENVGHLPFALEHDVGFSGHKMYHVVKVSPSGGFTTASSELSSADYDRYSRKSAIAAIRKLASGRASNPLSLSLPRNKWVNAKVQVTSSGKVLAKVDENVLSRIGKMFNGRRRNPDPWAPRKGTRLTPAQSKALKAYRFAVQQEDRYLGSVFVTPTGQRRHEAQVKEAYENAKRLGLGAEHGL